MKEENSKVNPVASASFLYVATVICFLVGGFMLDSSKVFEPYVGAIICQVLFVFAMAFLLGDEEFVTYKPSVFVPILFVVITSITLYELAGYFDRDMIEFYNSQSWDGCPSYPCIAEIRYSRLVQALITFATVAFVYKKRNLFAK